MTVIPTTGTGSDWSGLEPTSLTPVSVPGELIYQDWQYEYKGLLLGADTPFELQQFIGLTSIAPVRSGTVPRFGRHGGVPGRHYLDTKQLMATWDIFDPTCGANFRTYRDQLQQAFHPIEDPADRTPFVWKLPNRDKLRMYLRPIELNTPMDQAFSQYFGAANVRFEAADPFVYSNDEFSATLEMAYSTGGLEFPLEFPLAFGEGSVVPTNTAYNGGIAPAYFRAEVYGYAEDPAIEHVETGKVLHFPELVVPAGKTLIIDSRTRQVTIDGASRRSYMSIGSRWFDLAPGTNTLRFAAGDTTNGFARVYWRYQYWSD